MNKKGNMFIAIIFLILIIGVVIVFTTTAFKELKDNHYKNQYCEDIGYEFYNDIGKGDSWGIYKDFNCCRVEEVNNQNEEVCVNGA